MKLKELYMNGINRELNIEEKLVHQLIEEQSIETPEAFALTSPSFRWTYQELNHHGNQIARYIRKGNCLFNR